MSRELDRPKRGTKIAAAAVLAVGAGSSAFWGAKLHDASSEAGPVTRAVRDLGSASKALSPVREEPVPSSSKNFGKMVVVVNPDTDRATTEFVQAEGRLRSRGLDDEARRVRGIRGRLASEGASDDVLPDLASLLRDVAMEADKFNGRSATLGGLAATSGVVTILGPIGTLMFGPWTGKENEQPHRRSSNRHKKTHK